MSAPMTAAQIVVQLKEWGIPYKVYKSDWATHNRGDRGNGWSNLHGFMWHHTGSDSDTRQYLYTGSSDLPGPLCHFHIDQNGLLWLIGWGRANHAGGGDPTVLQHVINEDYTGILKPHYHEGESGAADGNGYFYGVEIGYSGNHEMAPKQYSTALKLSAAILDFHNWSEKSVIAHGEWSDWKWDPGKTKGTMMNMASVRGDIHNVLKAGPNSSKSVPTTPVVTKPAPAPTPVKPTPVTLDTISAKLDKIIKKLGA